MSIAGHVSRAMVSRYSHVRMEAKRRALDEIAVRQRTADEKRKGDDERREQVAVVSQSAVIQGFAVGRRGVCPSTQFPSGSGSTRNGHFSKHWPTRQELLFPDGALGQLPS
jgi:hypothetical protein